MKGSEVFDPRSHYFVQRTRRFQFLVRLPRRRRQLAPLPAPLLEASMTRIGTGRRAPRLRPRHQHVNTSKERPATVIRMHMWESVIAMMQAAMDPVPLYETAPELEASVRGVVADDEG